MPSRLLITILLVLSNGSSPALPSSVGCSRGLIGDTPHSIITEDRFPSKPVLEELKGALLTIIQKSCMNTDADALVSLVQDVSKEIALVFAPQDYSFSDSLLKVKSGEVSKRLMGTKLQKLKRRPNI